MSRFQTRDPATLVMGILLVGTVLLAIATVGLIGIAGRMSGTQERVVATVLELEILYDELGYRLPAGRKDGSEIPRAYLAQLSKRWTTEVRKLPIARKKDLFLRTVLPLVLRSNELIEQDRERAIAVLAARDAGSASKRDRAWLANLADSYDVRDDDGTIDAKRLLRRVDVIPVSLALGQSAYESGWSTSRFAGEANALYGQWTWSDRGIKPKKQRKGLGDYRVARFDSPLDSVRAYAYNLNTHRAYVEFRRKRAALRAAGKPLDGLVLADTMKRYSERGEAYIRTLKQMMRSNNLLHLDAARLRDDHRPIRIVPFES